MSDALMMAIGGGGAAVGGYVAVIVANKTNIEWLKSEIKRLEKAITTAHSRIDSILREHHR